MAITDRVLFDYRSSTISCQFVQGELGGPYTRYYETFEYVVWLLSPDAEWIPEKIHNFLIDGMIKWNAWCRSSLSIELGIAETFFNSLWRAKSYKTFKFGKKTRESLKNWISYSMEKLKIYYNPDDILEEFLNHGFIEYHFKKQSKKKQ